MHRPVEIDRFENLPTTVALEAAGQVRVRAPCDGTRVVVAERRDEVPVKHADSADVARPEHEIRGLGAGKELRQLRGIVGVVGVHLEYVLGCVS